MGDPAFSSDRINSFSLVSYIPGPLGEFITNLRQDLVSGCVAQSHVTVLPPRPIEVPIEEAEDALHQSLSGEIPMQDARLMMVNVYMKQRRHKDALDQLERYLEANSESPQRPAIEQMLAQIRKALGQN